MTTPAHDLSKLRIDRDAPPPGVRRAVLRNAIFAAVVVVIAASVLIVMRQRAVVSVTTVVAAASADPGGTGGGGAAASVTANGYVVARTRASVSSKVSGRLAYLGVAEGSPVQQGSVIARLENADYQA